MVKPKQICCWISDHVPSLAQRDYFEKRGYTIVQLRSPWPQRWQNADQIYSAMMQKCVPDIIIMVLPSQGLGGTFLTKVNVPVYQAETVNQNGFWEWTGRWFLISGTHYIKHIEDIPSAYGVR